MSRLSPLSDLPPGKENDFRFLLERVYQSLAAEIEILATAMKGRISNHEGQIVQTDGRLKRLEHCPCAVHRDPAHTCVILDVRDELAGIRAENAAQLSKINNRLAYWGGGLAVAIFLIEILARLLPVLWR